jgi:hypothetical protein
MKLKEKERDIILAALRLWQDEERWFEANERREYGEIATNSGKHVAMTADEIDELCEKLNR